MVRDSLKNRDFGGQGITLFIIITHLGTSSVGEVQKHNQTFLDLKMVTNLYHIFLLMK